LSFVQKLSFLSISESDSSKFLSDSGTLGCIKGLPHPLCVVSFGKSDSFLPPFHFHLFFFLKPNSKTKTHYA